MSGLAELVARTLERDGQLRLTLEYDMLLDGQVIRVASGWPPHGERAAMVKLTSGVPQEVAIVEAVTKTLTAVAERREREKLP